MRHEVVKTYGHELGFSACFRQWRAESHCRLLHGYALSFKFVFGSDELDARNWVIDFGALDHLKDVLRKLFDHTLLVAEDDPLKDDLLHLADLHVAAPIILPRVGCEAFAELGALFGCAAIPQHRARIVKLISCEVREHGANGAVFNVPSHDFDCCTWQNEMIKELNEYANGVATLLGNMP